MTRLAGIATQNASHAEFQTEKLKTLLTQSRKDAEQRCKDLIPGLVHIQVAGFAKKRNAENWFRRDCI